MSGFDPHPSDSNHRLVTSGIIIAGRGTLRSFYPCRHAQSAARTRDRSDESEAQGLREAAIRIRRGAGLDLFEGRGILPLKMGIGEHGAFR